MGVTLLNVEARIGAELLLKGAWATDIEDAARMVAQRLVKYGEGVPSEGVIAAVLHEKCDGRTQGVTSVIFSHPSLHVAVVEKELDSLDKLLMPPPPPEI